MAHVHGLRRRARRPAARGYPPVRALAPQAAQPLNPARAAGLVKRRALSLGFDAVGITDLSPPPHAAAFRAWLERGYAGTMAYMHRQAAKRIEPTRIAPGATRAIMTARNYYVPDPAPASGRGRVAKYARGTDYHEAMAKPLACLADFVRTLGSPVAMTRTYVDAGPVPERELAQRAGLGWMGKNTMLISPRLGSFVFLGAILTDIDLAVDPPFESDRCGSCTRCLDACPTDAFPAARTMDASRCIAYLTIEFRGDIPPELAPLIGDWIFGCDVCQDVCPWNVKFAREAAEALPNRDPDLAQLDLRALADAPPGELERRFAGTALTRPGAEGLRRNARIALANAARPEVEPGA